MQHHTRARCPPGFGGFLAVGEFPPCHLLRRQRGSSGRTHAHRVARRHLPRPHGQKPRVTSATKTQLKRPTARRSLATKRARSPESIMCLQGVESGLPLGPRPYWAECSTSGTGAVWGRGADGLDVSPSLVVFFWGVGRRRLGQTVLTVGWRSMEVLFYRHYAQGRDSSTITTRRSRPLRSSRSTLPRHTST